MFLIDTENDVTMTCNDWTNDTFWRILVIHYLVDILLLEQFFNGHCIYGISVLPLSLTSITIKIISRTTKRKKYTQIIVVY